MKRSSKLAAWAALPALLYLPSITMQAAPAVKGAQPGISQEKSPVAPRIVGGEEAIEGQWPWMSALVSTFSDVETSLEVANISYATEFFSFGAAGTATAPLASCGKAGEICSDVEAQICLIERGEFNFSEKADNCEAGGGIGAVIYNNVDGNIVNGTMGPDYNGTIPVVAISRADGLELLNQLGASATVIVEDTQILSQDASCGATYLGKKHVLTAAHCVNGPSASLLLLNVGEFDLRDGAENAISIEQIFVHPSYDEATFDYDIAVVQLSETLDVPAVQIASQETTDFFSSMGSAATTLGWGGRLGYEPNEGPTGDFPDILHQVETNLLTNEQCRMEFAQSQNIPTTSVGLTDRMICTAVPGGGRSACQGDSGGPLLVETNTGWQQVGVVSWGIGCAADGYPGVYARVSAVSDWLEATTDGVVIAKPEELGTVAVDSTASVSAVVLNNTSTSQNLSFSLQGSFDFTLDSSACETLAVDEKCELLISYAPTSAGTASATVEVDTDNDAIKTFGISLEAVALGRAEDVAITFPLSGTTVDWFTGGDANWFINDVGVAESGEIEDAQSTVLQARVEGPGILSFEWSVSSEENTDTPDDPFDALYLRVNGNTVNFISGDVSFAQETVELTEGTNIIEWAYEKDAFTTEFQDKGFVRNVQFSENAAPPPPPVTPPTPRPDSSGGGGSIAWLLIWLLASLGIRCGSAARR